MALGGWRTQMRGAVYARDGEAVVALLNRDSLPTTGLELAGEGLLSAVAQGVEGATDLAAIFVKGLRDRGWYGDRELADHLEGLLGTAPMPNLRPLHVNLDEVAAILEGDPLQGPGRVDVETGEVWPESEIEYAETVGEEEPHRWLWVTPNPDTPQFGYLDREMFLQTVTDLELRNRLQLVIDGPDAFRLFRETLADSPALLEEWDAFAEDRKRGRARSWLAAAGYRQAPPATPDFEI